MREGLLAGMALLLAGCAVAPGAGPGGAGDLTPLWRSSFAKLPPNTEGARQCLKLPDKEMDACALELIQSCSGGGGDEDAGPPPSGMVRQCAWSEIAGWEDVTAELLDELKAKYGKGAMEEDQAAWEKSMLLDVGIAASQFTGGSMEGMVAALARAEAQARRAIWLERLRRAYEE